MVWLSIEDNRSHSQEGGNRDVGNLEKDASRTEGAEDDDSNRIFIAPHSSFDSSLPHNRTGDAQFVPSGRNLPNVWAVLSIAIHIRLLCIHLVDFLRDSKRRRDSRCLERFVAFLVQDMDRFPWFLLQPCGNLVATTFY